MQDTARVRRSKLHETGVILCDSNAKSLFDSFWNRFNAKNNHRRSHLERPIPAAVDDVTAASSLHSAHIQKSTKTASVSTFISWPRPFTLCGLCDSSLLFRLID